MIVTCKKSYLILFTTILLICAFLMVSCTSNDDDDNESEPNIAGYWHTWHGQDDYKTDAPGFLTITQDGDTISASHSCHGEEPWAEGFLEGNLLTLNWTLTEEDGSPVHGYFDGQVLDGGDTIFGTSYEGGTVTMHRSQEHVCHPDEKGRVLAEYPESDAEGDLSPLADDETFSCSEGINMGNHFARGSTFSKTSGDKTDYTADGHYVPEELTCIEQKYDAAQDRQTDNTPRLVPNQIDAIFPGSLLQGGQYLDGSIAPITSKRGGGTLVVSGMTCTGDADMTVTIDEVSEAAVTEALNGILHQCKSAEGDVSNLFYKNEAVYSSDHMLFSLGLKAEFEGSELSNQFSIDKTSNSNYIMMKFNQVFYNVDFQLDDNDPQNLFGDDASCVSRNFGKTNPTVLVDSVSYGRTIFFMVNSEYSETDIKDTMEGAYHGEAGTNVTGNAKLTYTDVMSKSSVVYSVFGGDSSYATKPISADSPEKMYDAIKDLISDQQSSKWSLSNPAAPISYTLAYADDLSTAIDNISTSYNQRSCSPKTGGYEMWVTNTNDNAYFYVDHHDKKHTEEDDHSTYFIHEDTKDHTIEFKVKNQDCGSSSAHFRLYRYGSLYWGRDYKHAWASTCGTQYYAEWDINASTGLARKVTAKGYHGLSWKSSDW